MVQKHPDDGAAWESALVFGTVPAEQMLSHGGRVRFVHVALHGDDLDLRRGHDPHVDAPGVVPVDQHDVLVGDR